MSDSSKRSTKKKSTKRTKKKMNTKKKVLLTMGIILLFFIGVGLSALGYGYSLLGKMDKVEVDESNLGIDKEVDDKLSQYTGIRNIALFGIDATDGGTGRSDSIMILTIDTNRNKLKVSSLMRDSYVNIKNDKMNKQDKLNHAYAFGGAELAIKTINENFDLNITDFAAVNFTNLPKLIDKVGGLKLTVTTEELPGVNKYIGDSNQKNGTNSPTLSSAGTQVLNGTQVLAYSRIRSTAGGDYERTQRQREVLNALFDKFKTLSPTKYPSLLNDLLPMIQTSLGASEILDLATTVVSMGNINLEQNRFPTDAYSNGEMIGGVYYLTFDKTATVKQIHDYIFEDINQ